MNRIQALLAGGAVSLAMFVLSADASVTNGLVLRYSFDNNGGSTVTDLSGSGNNGVVEGAQWVATAGGGAYHFGGTDRIVGTTAGFPVGGASRTVSFWMKSEAYSGHLFKYGATDISHQMYSIGYNDVGGVGFTAYGDDVQTPMGYAPGTWHHVCITYDANQTRIYMDGALAASGYGNLNTMAGQPLYVGYHFYTGYSGCPGFVGLIDEVRVYNRALGASEVAQVYGEDSPNTGASGTKLSGVVEGTLSREGSPYHVDGNLSVPAGSSLRIEPGVTLVFDGHYYVDVDGQITAEGTIDEPVVFTASDTDTGWAGIRIVGNWEDNAFYNTVFEYGRALGWYQYPYYSPEMEGAAIYVNEGRALADGCVFRFNLASVHGSAVSGEGQMDISVLNSTLVSNETVYGMAAHGPLYFNGFNSGLITTKVQVVNCDIARNKSTDGATSIYTVWGFRPDDVLIANNIIHHNVCNGGAGAASFGGGQVLNNVFYGNECGWGWNVDFNWDVTFRNNIVYGNSDTPDILHVTRGSAVVEYNCIEGGYVGTGNIGGNPLFVDPDNGDFRLMETSPCIDTGLNQPELPVCDYMGLPRIVGSSVDMGAIEWTSEPAPESLVLHYSFDDDDGSTVTDLSASGNNGVVEGAQWVATDGGGAYRFGGTDRIVGTTLDFPAGGASRTVSLWMRSEAYYGHLFKYGATDISHQMYFIGYNDVGGVGFTAYGDDLHTPMGYAPGTWHHVCITYDANQTRIYMDGALAASGYGNLNTMAGQPLYIGYHFYTGYSGCPGFVGLIDEVRVYDTALTASQVEDLYSRDLPGMGPNVYWLDTGVEGNGSIDVGDGWFNEGTSVVITATPDPEHEFVSWSGDTAGCAVDGAKITVSMERARSVVASFKPALPDFRIHSISLTNSSVYKNKMTAYVTITNAGLASGYAGSLDIWVNRALPATERSHGVSCVDAGTFTPGEVRLFIFENLNFPAAGDNWFRAFIDSQAVTAESDETNNQQTLLAPGRQARGAATKRQNNGGRPRRH